VALADWGGEAQLAAPALCLNRNNGQHSLPIQ
jgi:hypothetical protein